MLVTLLRTGGIIPMTKKAEKEVDWTEDEMQELLKKIKNSEEGPGQQRDATSYHLTSTAGTFSIDWEKIPPKYLKTFEDLKDNLKFVKT